MIVWKANKDESPAFFDMFPILIPLILTSNLISLEMRSNRIIIFSKLPQTLISFNSSKSYVTISFSANSPQTISIIQNLVFHEERSPLNKCMVNVNNHE